MVLLFIHHGEGFLRECRKAGDLLDSARVKDLIKSHAVQDVIDKAIDEVCNTTLRTARIVWIVVLSVTIIVELCAFPLPLSRWNV